MKLPHVIDWLQREPQRLERQWLMLGKGPSLAQMTDDSRAGREVLALNHVIREFPATLAHAIDLEVIDDCAEALMANADALVMPWNPHERYRPTPLASHDSFRRSRKSLPELAEEIEVLGELAAAGRLLWYELRRDPGQTSRSTHPLIEAHAFSATAALEVLAAAGVRSVRSLGVDGGRGYASGFADLMDSTHLAAGQESFDLQFTGFARTLHRSGLDFAPLTEESPIQVYVGAEVGQGLATRVLEYSIRRHCSMSVKVSPLWQAIEDTEIRIDEPADPALRPRTPFSFQRFAIPEIKRHVGRAIYLDSDMLVFGDLRQLWTWPMGGASILACAEPEDSGRAPQFSVMLMDCAALKWRVNELLARLSAGEWSYEEFAYQLGPAETVARALPSTWNDLERYTPEHTQLIHYTDMSTQPWLSHRNLNGRIWCQYLFDAVDAGHIRAEEVTDAVDQGLVRPSLRYQLEQRLVDPLLLPRRIKLHDDLNFIPPHAEPGHLRRLRLADSWASRFSRLAFALLRNLWLGMSGPARLRAAQKFFRSLRRSIS